MVNKQDPFKSVGVDEEAPKVLLKKEAKKVDKPKIIQKYYFDVRVDCMIPATLTYRILAEDAEQAANLIKGKPPNSVNYKLLGRKEIILKVYMSGSMMMKYIRKLLA